jgi:UDP-N-acetylmuramate--alanine ligase
MTHVHLIGIGGSGISAIARLLLESGVEVTGSDRTLSPFAVDLQKAGVRVSIGHDAKNVAGADMVVRSSAIPDDNPEVRAALEAGTPVLKRSDFIGEWMASRTGIAVAGTHGKTTTTAMIAWMLHSLDQDPSFIVGGVINNLGVNAHAGKGKPFVIEADEYDRMFLGLRPIIEVITNLEHDHPDCYPTMADMTAAFEEFIRLLPNEGTLVASAEDKGAAGMLHFAQRQGRRTVTFSIQGEITISTPLWVLGRNVKPNNRGGYSFDAISNLPKGGLQSVSVALRVPGEHNVRNALAAMAVTGLLGLPLDRAARALGEFEGTGRRFEIRAETGGILVIDDYAHHPTEIRATLAGARARYPQRRIWAVWQPHTYSRTKALFDQFVHAFDAADQVVVTEVYAAREAKQNFSAGQIVQNMSHPGVHFIPTLSEVSNYLITHLRAGDVLLVLSAGDADQVSTEVLTRLKGK